MYRNQPQLGSILLRHGVISEAQLEQALAHARERQLRLGEALIRLGLCSEVEITRTLAQQMDLPFVDLHETPPSPALLRRVPRDTALRVGAVPVRMEGRRLLVAARDPFDLRVDDMLRRATGECILVAAGVESQIDDLLRRYDQVKQEPEAEPPAPLGTAAPGAGTDPVISGESAVVVERVNALLAACLRRGASDIHLEPGGNSLKVRIRVDGRFVDLGEATGVPANAVVLRIKTIAGLDPGESRRVQQGTCRVRVDGESVELRVSSLPGLTGEMLALRAAGRTEGARSLESLGLPATISDALSALMAARHGLLLVTGPEGSGRRTTLTALVGELASGPTHVMALENTLVSGPKSLEGVHQLRADTEAGATTAELIGVCADLEPDVLALGDLAETGAAVAACRAGLRGVLVLARVQSADAVGAVTRMTTLGVAPRDLSAALSGVLCQRLVPRNCETCSEEYDAPAELRRALESRFPKLRGARFRRGRGCPACRFQGTLGRTGVYELLTVDEDVRVLLADRAAPSELRTHLKGRGFRPLLLDAVEKTREGVIPPEELLELALADPGAGPAPAEGTPPPPAQFTPLPSVRRRNDPAGPAARALFA